MMRSALFVTMPAVARRPSHRLMGCVGVLMSRASKSGKGGPGWKGHNSIWMQRLL